MPVSQSYVYNFYTLSEIVSCSLGAFAKLRKATIRFVMSGRLSAWNSSAPTGGGRILMKFGIRDFFENLLRKLKFD